MKKSLIAASASAVALAAMPVVGAFAVTLPASNIVDNLTFTLAGGCSMAREEGTRTPAQSTDPTTVYTVSNTVPMNITVPGTVSEVSGLQVNITCNGGSGVGNTGTWLLKAVGNGTTSHEDQLASDGNYISTSTSNLDGSTSGWAFKITNNTGTGNTDNFDIEASYDEYSLVPASTNPATIATLTYDGEASGNVGSYAFTPTYKVSVANNQATGTYTGSVKYTIVAGS